jgi:hypothetical protein
MPNIDMMRAHRLVWAIVGLTVAVDAAAVALGILDRSVQSLTATWMFTIVTIGFASLGALIVSRQRGNAFGWLFITLAVFLSVPHNLLQNYAVYALVVAPDPQLGGKVAFWLSSQALDGMFVLLMTLLLLLFPDGRPLTPRWRPVVWCAVLGAICTLSQGFTDFTSEPPLGGISNPLVVTGTGATALRVIAVAGFAPTLIGFFGGVASMVLRFRRSAGVERQQVKWVVAGVVLVAVMIVFSTALRLAGGPDYSALTFVAAIVLFPTVMGVAILRYRLYDIDVVIRRTLVYACLIAVLALLYFGGITILGAAFRSATGESGTLAVTLSTLIVAVGFQPLRRRIQHAIDHRFARRAYDAEAAVRAFTGRLREQIDLDVLSHELVGVVDDTVQPRHASLWLRPSNYDA